MSSTAKKPNRRSKRHTIKPAQIEETNTNLCTDQPSVSDSVAASSSAGFRKAKTKLRISDHSKKNGSEQKQKEASSKKKKNPGTAASGKPPMREEHSLDVFPASGEQELHENVKRLGLLETAPLNPLAVEYIPTKTEPAHPNPLKSSFKAQRVKKVAPRAKQIQISECQHMSPQAKDLCEQLAANKYECMICCEIIRSQGKIWNCENCFSLYHFGCIQKWASSQASGLNKMWRCPGCQNPSDESPRGILCFCGKSDGSFPYSLIPHTCGNSCSKIRGKDAACLRACPHPCMEPCHPGPCMRCQVMISVKCFCEKSSLMMRCEGGTPTSLATIPRSCGKICGRDLVCGSHTCQLVCHEGPCSECTFARDAHCYCGSVSKSNFPCSESQLDNFTLGSFSCRHICGKLLSCGLHTCSADCHVGPCSACVSDPSRVQTCPCGSTPLFLARKLCTDPIPTCQRVCNKPLPCNRFIQEDSIHLCPSLCHLGDCPPCQERRLVECRCGSRRKKIPCTTLVEIPAGCPPFECELVCKKSKSCGRHRCFQKCCPSSKISSEESFHKCTLFCGKTLSCSLHKCENLCHKGPCPPCLNASFEELSCRCGKTILYPPIPCGTPLPPCSNPCSRPHSCSHPVQHCCHDEESCPLCCVLVDKSCFCGRQLRRHVPCHISYVSCGIVCSKALPCGHFCPNICHPGDCISSEQQQQVCKQPCSLPRKHCSHTCMSPCHPGTKCPNIPCRAPLLVFCRCGRRQETQACNISSLVDAQSTGFYADMMKSSMDSNTQPLSLPSATSLARLLPCDDECFRLQRNQRLAEALQIDSNRSSLKVDPYSQYGVYLSEFAKSNLHFIKSVEKIFLEFIEKSTPSKILPPMNSRLRKVVKLLARHYELETHSVDPEPCESIMIVRTHSTRAPLCSLSSRILQGGPSFAVAFDSFYQIAQNINPLVEFPHLSPNSLYFSSLPLTTTPSQIFSLIENFFSFSRGSFSHCASFLWDGGQNAAVYLTDSSKITKIPATNFSTLIPFPVQPAYIELDSVSGTLKRFLLYPNNFYKQKQRLEQSLHGE